MALRLARQLQPKNNTTKHAQLYQNRCTYTGEPTRCLPPGLRRQYATHSNDDSLNKVSRNITQPKSQGASQAMLYATGIDEAGMNKAQVGISSVWFSGNPCNMHLLDLSNIVKTGCLRRWTTTNAIQHDRGF